MRLSVLLGGYLLLMATAAPWALSRIKSLSRTPRLGLALWQACAATVVGSAALLLLVKAPDNVSHRIAAALELCVHTGHRVYSVSGRGIVGSVALIAVLLLAARISIAAFRVSHASLSRRFRQRDLLALVGSPIAHERVVMIEDATPVAYCVPGRKSCVVMTSGALEALDNRQFAAVLEHERAHLSERHHLVVGAFDVLVSAFPFVTGFRLARDHVARLVEMIADDAAVRRFGTEAVSGALLRLGAFGPVGLLNAGGPGVFARVERLLDTRRASTLLQTSVAMLTLAILALPIVLVLMPAINPAAHGFCPL